MKTLTNYKSTLGNYLLGTVLLGLFGLLVLEVKTHPKYLVLVYALALGLLFPLAKGNAFKLPVKWAQAVEHYILGLVITGGFGSVLLAFQKHAQWKDLLITFVAALVLPLLKSTGLVSSLVGLVTKQTGLPATVVTPLVEDAVKVVTQKVETVVPVESAVTSVVTVGLPASPATTITVPVVTTTLSAPAVLDGSATAPVVSTPPSQTL